MRCGWHGLDVGLSFARPLPTGRDAAPGGDGLLYRGRGRLFRRLYRGRGRLFEHVKYTCGATLASEPVPRALVPYRNPYRNPYLCLFAGYAGFVFYKQ